jgi:hypothetical protein
MGSGFDWEELKRQWNGTRQVINRGAVYNPLSGQYVPIPPGTAPTNAPADLALAGPNSTEARLAHVQILVSAGIITAQEGSDARDRILHGL